MAQVNSISTNFTTGEISPALKGRVDVAKYFNGAQELVNFIVKPQGGAYRRRGTAYVNATKSNGAARLIPFEFNAEQSYVLEFGNLYLRIHRPTASGPGTVEEAANTPLELTTPYTSSDLDEITFAQTADILYVAHPDYAPRKITRSTTAPTGVDDSAQESGGGNYWSIDTVELFDGPYLDENDDEAKVMTLTKVTDRVTVTMSGVSFTNTATDAGKQVSYKDNGYWRSGTVVTVNSSSEAVLNDRVVKLVDGAGDSVTFSGSSGTVTATANTANFFKVADFEKWLFGYNGTTYYIAQIAGYPTGSGPNDQVSATIDTAAGFSILNNYPTRSAYPTARSRTGTVTANWSAFASTDVGRWLRLRYRNGVVIAKISAYTSATQVSVTIESDFVYDDSKASALEDAGATYKWRLGAWGGTNGYPACVSFHEQRLVFARSSYQPQTIWMSVSGDYENFAPTEDDGTVLDDNAITYTIASGKANYITWLESGPTLLVGTIGNEWQVKSASTIGEPLTPTNVTITPQTAYGSITGADAVRVGSSVIFIQRSGQKLREMRYNFEADSFESRDITILSEHILRNGENAKYVAFQTEPTPILWTLLNDGTLAGLTFDRDQDVYAWHRHEIGGSGIVESIATIPNDDGTEQNLWMVVRRTINGSTTRYVEMLLNEFNPSSSTDKDEMIYLDSHLSGSGSGGTAAHLPSTTISVVGDGGELADVTTNGSGAFTLDSSYTLLHAGFGYTSTLRTVEPEGGLQEGSSQGRVKRLNTVTFRLLNSIGLEYGVAQSDTLDLSFRNIIDNMGVSPALYTGDKSVNVKDNYDGNATLYVEQSRPYPLNILAIVQEWKAY